jgi:hypothetical protein
VIVELDGNDGGRRARHAVGHGRRDTDTGTRHDQ